MRPPRSVWRGSGWADLCGDDCAESARAPTGQDRRGQDRSRPRGQCGVTVAGLTSAVTSLRSPPGPWRYRTGQVKALESRV